MRVFLAIFLLIQVIRRIEGTDYTGWETIEIVTPDKESMDVVNRVATDGVKIMLEPSVHRPAEIAIPPGQIENVVQILKRENLAFYVIDKNLQSVIDKELKNNRKAKAKAHIRRRSVSTMEHLGAITKVFPSYAEIQAWLERLHVKYPEQTKLINIGESFENRSQFVFTIGDDGKKPVVWIQGGMHAREWAAMVSNLNTIYQLLTNPEVKDLVSKFAWYFQPVANPDGYEYSIHNDRLWRKNRRPVTSNCTGVDLNRNWPVHFAGVGTSSDPCSNIYPGPAALSEPETKNIAQFLKTVKGRIRMFMDVHAYGRLLLMPWGYDHKKQLKNNDEMRRVAKAAIRAMKKSSSNKFKLGAPGDILYNAAGSMMDFMSAVEGVPFAFAPEVSPGFYDGNGFLADVKDLPKITEEVWQGIAAAARAIE